ncbi:hypothetical protein HYW21_00045 [Candidatus Woesearchaeota archaeon]|nr:hypothetical protein [Candidatus Woesearchaeota archaeon]
MGKLQEQTALVVIVMLGLILFLPGVLAEEATVEDKIHFLVEQAKAYEEGKISYAQMVVHANAVREEINKVFEKEIIEVTLDEHDRRRGLSEQAVRSIFGEPTEETSWARAENLRKEYRLDAPVPRWEKTIFDGNKIQITMNAWPQVIVEDEKTTLFYHIDFDPAFKKVFTLETDALLNDLSNSVQGYVANETSPETIMKEVGTDEHLLNQYVEQNRGSCEWVMNEIFDGKKSGEQHKVRLTVPIYSTDDLELIMQTEYCSEDCPFQWVNTWYELESRGPGPQGKQENGGQQSQEELRRRYETLSSEELFEKIREVTDDLVFSTKQSKRDAWNTIEKARQEINVINDLLNRKQGEMEHRDRAPEKSSEKVQEFFTQRVSFITSLMQEYGDVKEEPITQIGYEYRIYENIEERTNGWCQNTEVKCKDDEGCLNGGCIFALGGEEDCKNRVDDDGDQIVDCGDPDCLNTRECGSNTCEDVCNPIGGCWDTTSKLCESSCTSCNKCQEENRGDPNKCEAICQESCWPCNQQDTIQEACDECWNCEDQAYGGGCRQTCKPCNECNEENNNANNPGACDELCKPCRECEYTAGMWDCQDNQAFNDEKAFCECTEGFYDCNGDWKDGCESRKSCKPEDQRCFAECETCWPCINEEVGYCDNSVQNCGQLRNEAMNTSCQPQCDNCMTCQSREELPEELKESCKWKCWKNDECLTKCYDGQEIVDGAVLNCRGSCGGEDDKVCLKNCLEENSYICDGQKQYKPCEEEEVIYICDGKPSKTQCPGEQSYLCHGVIQSTPCEGIPKCEVLLHQRVDPATNSCTCEKGWSDCDQDGSCETEGRCKIGREKCDNRADDDDDFMADCNDLLDCPENALCGVDEVGNFKTCQNQQCLPIAACSISCGECAYLDPEACVCRAEKPCCGNDVCEDGEDYASCILDCVPEEEEEFEKEEGTEEQQPEEETGEGEEQEESPEETIEQDNRSNDNLSNEQQNITTECANNEVLINGTCMPREQEEQEQTEETEQEQQEATERVCLPGETKTEACESGDTITTEECIDNAWVPTNIVCPLVTREQEQLNEGECVLISDCGTGEVCSLGECITLTFEEEAEEEITEEQEEPTENEEGRENIPREETGEQTPPEQAGVQEQQEPMNEEQPEVREDAPGEEVPREEEKNTEPSQSTENEQQPQEGEAEGEASSEREVYLGAEPMINEPETFLERLKKLTGSVVASGNECRDHKDCDDGEFCIREPRSERYGVCVSSCETNEDCPDPNTQACWGNECHCRQEGDENDMLVLFNCDGNFMNGCESQDPTCGGTKDPCGEMRCENPNQWCDPAIGDCRCKEGFNDCNGDWKDGCESTKECYGCTTDADCAAPRCEEWGNRVIAFTCKQGPTWVEERGVFQLSGSCDVHPTGKVDGYVHFDMWGDPFEKLQGQRFDGNRQEEWCSWELENLKKERAELEASLNDAFLNWFFTEYITQNPMNFEQYIGGIFEVYWKGLVENSRETAMMLQCLGSNEWPSEYHPLSLAYEGELGSVKIWEEESTMNLNELNQEFAQEFGNEKQVIFSPYMQISIFPPKELVKEIFKESWEEGYMPGPPEEREKYFGPSTIEVAAIKADPGAMAKIKEISDSFENGAVFTVSIRDDDEDIFKALVRINEDVIFRAEPLPQNYTEEPDATVEVDFDFIYNLISKQEKEGFVEYPPWEERPKEVVKEVVKTISAFTTISTGIATGKIKVEPFSQSFKILGLIKDVATMKEQGTREEEDMQERTGKGGKERST